MTATEVIQKINIVDGCFTPSEANDIVEAMIEGKINFHKVKRLQQWLGDCNCETKDTKLRIEELTQEQAKAKAFFEAAQKAGKKVVIKGKLVFSFED